MTDSSPQLIREDVPACKARFTPEISRPVSGKVVRLAGVEPATLGLEVRCSIQLSYRRVRHLGYTSLNWPTLAEQPPKEAPAREKNVPRTVTRFPRGSVGDGRFPRWACVAFCLPPRRAEVTHEARDRRPHRRSRMLVSRPRRAW